ncbi:MAG: M20/M25/M40 family metallo-hydrolase [Pseudohongiellaceae bacterium]
MEKEITVSKFAVAAAIIFAVSLASAQVSVAPNSNSQDIASAEAENASSPTTTELIHHSLRVSLDPYSQSISVEDTITFPVGTDIRALEFSLNENLVISSNSGNLNQLPSRSAARGIGINNTGAKTASFNRYSLALTARANNQASVIYNGSVYDLAQQSGAEYAQSFAETSGIIGEQGVYLNKGSLWIPDFGETLITFDLQVDFAPRSASWSAVSQGDRFGENRWRSSEPMEEVYLIAAQFTEYTAQYNDIEILAYLREPDRNLANKYLGATERYLALYEPLLGDYPYSKFALIENFWETGYGMPSFTLLGQQVIRFPFILESSYPHEILHNWWGNGVYPDYDSGNWSEGLTAYLADHLFREMDGAGSEYRKEMLARYKNYVAEDDDFALSRFTSRNSAATQAVGYGKTLMLWHMLRIELGDELFLSGLRRLYQDYKFKRATFSDIARLFSVEAGFDLMPFFNQWVNRIGAPTLSFSVNEVGDNQARIIFAQLQADDPYSMTVPVALYYQDEEYPQIYNIALGQKVDAVIADNFDRLQGILVDPYFDVFRTLDREETPPTVGELFGAGEITFVLPQTNQQYWREMATSFAAGVDAEIVVAEDLEVLPVERSVWVLGRDNKFATVVSEQLENFNSDIGSLSVSVADQELEYADRATVLVARHPNNSDLALGWIAVDDMAAMPGMIEKLPHYGKYSYLSFAGTEPTNDTKGVWASSASPMRWVKPGVTAAINWDRLPTSLPLATLPPKYLPEQLLGHVTELTGPSMAGRAIGSNGIDEAARYLSSELQQIGLQPLSRRYMQTWSQPVQGQGTIRLSNVFGILPGSNPELANQPVVVGAHYDHLGMDSATGQVFVGADDNASGVAVMLEVASKLAGSFSPQRPIIFAAFTGEEAGLLGSQHFIDNLPAGFDVDEIFAMVNLDSVGRLGDRELQVFGTDSAYEFPFMAQGIGFTIGVNSVLPAQTIASSDHVTFLNAGIPSMHLFAGVTEDYHQLTDTPDKLDAEGMSNIALWLEEALVYLADNVEPLRVTMGGVSVPVQRTGAGAREASLGTVPDFAYAGQGIRISAASPGGAAADAGLQAGDVLLSFNGAEIESLQVYSNLIREAAVGDRVMLEIRRSDQLFSVEVTLKSR